MRRPAPAVAERAVGSECSATIVNGPPVTADKEKEGLDQQNQLEIRLEVQRLLAMTELTDEVDNTNSLPGY